MMLMLEPCQNTAIPMHSSQWLLLESGESEVGILMGTDFLCRVFKPSCLQMQKDWESKLSLSLSLLQKNAPSTPCVRTHMCVCFGSSTSNLGEV